MASLPCLQPANLVDQRDGRFPAGASCRRSGGRPPGTCRSAWPNWLALPGMIDAALQLPTHRSQRAGQDRAALPLHRGVGRPRPPALPCRARFREAADNRSKASSPIGTVRRPSLLISRTTRNPGVSLGTRNAEIPMIPRSGCGRGVADEQVGDRPTRHPGFPAVESPAAFGRTLRPWRASRRYPNRPRARSLRWHQ